MPKLEIPSSQIPFDRRVSSTLLSFLSPKDIAACRSVSRNWRDTIEEIYPSNNKSIISAFNQTVAQKPQNIFLRFNQIQLTYQQAGSTVDRLAAVLLHRRYQPGTRIAVYLPNSHALVIAILAIWKAGLVYVPLPYDHEVPTARLLFVRAHVTPALIITSQLMQRSEFCLTAADRQPFLLLNEQGDLISEEVQQHTDFPLLHPDQAAYIFYTSGSTGEPRGVVCTHHGIRNSILSNILPLNIQSHDRILGLASSGFDAFLMEMCMAFANAQGSTLCILPRRENGQVDIARIPRFCQEQQVTVMIASPALLEIFDPNDFTNVKVVSTGQKLFERVFRKWSQDDQVLYNGYGQVQVDICSAMGKCDPTLPISVGPAIPRLRFHFFEPTNWQKVPFATISKAGTKTTPTLLKPVDNINASAELYISGIGLGKGYWRDPEDTQKHFFWITDPDDPSNVLRVFKTGDMVTRDANGNIYVEGRIPFDKQTKVASKLICPEELEALIHQTDNQLLCYVGTTPDDMFSSAKLVVYVFKPEAHVINYDLLWLNIAAKLPAAMYPAYWYELDLRVYPEMLNASHKIDKKKIEPYCQNLKKHYLVGAHRCGSKSEIEQTLVQLWRKTLNIPDDVILSHDSHFFQLGGTSLDLLSLVRQIEKHFNILDIVNFDELIRLSPTLGCMARTIKRFNSPQKSPLFRLHGRFPADKPLPPGVVPLILIHTLMGDARIDYKDFITDWQAQHNDRPIFAFSAAGLKDKELASDSIEEMAAHFLEALDVLASPAYVFAAWSAGGHLLYRMVGELQRRGIAATGLMIDTEAACFTQKTEPVRYSEKYLTRFFNYDVVSGRMHLTSGAVQELVAYATSLAHLPKLQQVHLVLDKAVALVDAAAIDNEKKTEATNFIESIRGIYVAILHFEPITYPKDVTLLCADASVEKLGKRLGWPEQAQLELVNVVGNHFTVMLHGERTQLPFNYVAQLEKMAGALPTNIPTHQPLIISIKIPHYLPFVDIDTFVGRKNELDALRGYFDQQTQTVQVMALTGLPGMGKSTIAYHMAQEASQSGSYDFVAFIRNYNELAEFFLNHSESIKQKFAGVYKGTKQQCLDIMKESFAHFNKWFLVIDDGSKEVKGELPVGRGHILITTVSSDGWVKHRSIENMNEEESIALACERLGLDKTKAADRNDARLLAWETLGGYPLAIEQACSYLKDSMSIKEYVELYNKRYSELWAVETGTPAHEKTVYTSLEFLLQDLEKSPEGVNSMTLLARLSLFARTIPRCVTEQLVHDPLLRKKFFHPLLNRSLVTYNSGTFSHEIHPMVSKSVFEFRRRCGSSDTPLLLKENIQALIEASPQFSDLSAKAMQERYRLVETYQELLRHAKAMLLPKDESLLLLTEQYALLRTRLGHFQQAINLQKEVIAQRDDSATSFQKLRSLRIMATVHMLNDELEDALRYYTQAQNIESSSSTESDTSWQEEMGHVHNGLSIVNRRLSKFEVALQHSDRAINIRRRFFPQTNDHATSVNNRADILLPASRIDEAVQCLKEAISIWTAIDPNHENIIRGLYNLALIYVDFKLIDEAKSALVRSVEIADFINKNNYCVPYSLRVLAEISMEERKYQLAFDQAKAAVDSARSNFSPNHPDRLEFEFTFQRAQCSLNSNSIEECEKIFNELLRTHGTRCDLITRMLHNLIKLCVIRGLTEKIEQYIKYANNYLDQHQPHFIYQRFLIEISAAEYYLNRGDLLGAKTRYESILAHPNLHDDHFMRKLTAEVQQRLDTLRAKPVMRM